MFESLTEKLNGVFNRLGNQGRLTERDVDSALREIRMALLEADVNFRVARSFVGKIRERALSEEVLQSLSPGQQVVKITNEEMTAILDGGENKVVPGSTAPSVILMIGLNGSGKTTTAAKLARHLKQAGQLPVLVAADLNRPAAIDQLQTLGRQIDVEVYEEGTSRPTPKVAREGVKRAADVGASWAIVDTAGRTQIDDDLMSELEEVKEAVSPVETLLVVDAMTGQDAVNAAKEFHERIGVTGLVLSKLDGDARGGAALSIVSVTGVPIKFIATGEGVDALEEFHPDRLASRILGMGDMLTLIEKTQEAYDEEEAAALERKMRQATFDLNDFLDQLEQVRKMGGIGQILDMMPGMPGLKGKMPSEDLTEKQLKRTEAIVFSMTPQERARPEIINGRRRRRIAQGSGTTPRDVNQLLNQFKRTRRMMRQMSSKRGMRDMMRMVG